MSKQLIILITLSFLLLSGCASVTPDAGFTEVQATVHKRNGQTPVWLRSEAEIAHQQTIVHSILKKPLSAEDAVRIAVMNNASLQASLAELGIAEADLVQAGRMQNPGFSYSRLTPVGHEYNIERRVLFDVMSLLTIPMRTAIERQRFCQAKLHAAMEVLEIAAKTRKAYYTYVASHQMLQYLEKVKEAAEASAQLARSMAEVGNWNKLQQAREQTFYAQVMTQCAKAKMMKIQAREQLIRMMGLWGRQIDFKTLERLSELPSSVQEPFEFEKQALINRLDIQVMKRDIESKCKSLGLTKATRFVDVLDFGYASNSGDDIPHQRGYEIGLSVPLFDWGDAKVAKAQKIYMQSVWQLREMAINARSEVREAYQIYRTSYDLAKFYRDEVVPLRKQILNESLLRYNGMLIGTFELLADEREQISSVNAYIEALRDFWLAEVDLQTTLMVKSPHSTHS